MSDTWQEREVKQTQYVPKKRLTYTISENLHYRFVKASERDNRKMSNVVERAIQNYCVANNV